MYAAAFDFLAEIFAWPLTQFYALTSSYAFSIMLITVVVMAVTTPLTLKSTKGMLEMQKLQPELRRLQQQHRGDRQMLNQEMMKLYQEHKVNPLASCFPLLLQMPVFFGMFSLLRGLTQNRDVDQTFIPRIIDASTDLYKDLSNSTEMLSWGMDLSKSPAKMLNDSPGKGVIYVLVVVLLGFLYWVQQRMIANRSVSPTMSATQAKIMQYLPVAFAVFQVFFPLGLVVYYIWQTVLRIGQQYYITRRFYHGDEALGRQAQAASSTARDMAKVDKASGDSPRGGLGAGRTTSARPGAKPSGRPTGRPQPSRGTTPAKGPAKGTSPTGTSSKGTSSKGTSSKGGASRPTPSGKAPRPQTTTRTPQAKGSAAGSATPPSKPTKPVKPVKPQKPQKPSN